MLPVLAGRPGLGQIVITVAQMTDFASRKGGGLFESVRGLSRALQEESLARVTVITKQDEAVAADRSAWGSVEVVPIEVRGFRRTFTGGDIADAFLNRPSDVMHVHALWTCTERAVVNLHRRGTRAPYIVSPRGTLAPWALSYKRWKKRLSWPIWERSLFANAACLHALNEAEACMIRDQGIKAPICVLPNGINLPEVCERHSSTRRQLLYLGRLHPIKGLPELITAWGQIAPELRTEWQLVLAGWDDSPEAPSYRSMAADVMPEGSIVFAGAAYGEAKERLFRQANAFILPSLSEGLPSSVLEAWSYQLPVLMTDACNLGVGFMRGAARRIEPRADHIASVLPKFLAQSDADLETMGRAGRHLVEENFTWKAVATDMAAVYRWTLGGERPDCIISM